MDEIAPVVLIHLDPAVEHPTLMCVAIEHVAGPKLTDKVSVPQPLAIAYHTADDGFAHALVFLVNGGRMANWTEMDLTGHSAGAWRASNENTGTSCDMNPK